MINFEDSDYIEVNSIDTSSFNNFTLTPSIKFFDGNISNFFVKNRCLSEDEIKKLYKDGKL